MKIAKRLFVALLVLSMCFTTLLFGKITAKADEGVTIKLHYHRADEAYSPWSVWFWEYGKDGSDNPFAEENGEMVASFQVSPGTTSVGFIVRTANWEKDISDDQFIDISEMVSGTVHIYVESGVVGFTEEYGDDAVKGTKLRTAKYDNVTKTVNIEMTGDIAYDYNEAFSLRGKNDEIAITGVEFKGNGIYVLSTEEELNLFKNYSIIFEGQGYKVNMPNTYSSTEFEKEYTYTGNDLGANWTKESTTFKVWAPTAEAVSLRLYEKGDTIYKDKKDEIEMTKGDKGVWEVTVSGDLNGTYYTYCVTNDGTPREACDPYARTTGVNGERAMVIDLDSTDPEGWEQDTNPHAGENITDAIIYEAHIRDLTVEEGAGIEHVGKYLGVAEAGTKTESGISTGIDHMKDLGITHLHILPFYDFGSVDEKKTVTSQYNWGYDPVNYNVPEGSYSTDAYNGEVRVKEVKEMVKSLHDNGISVVMDVVYNHVQSASSFCFNTIVPGYFSRIDEKGNYSGGSGCGNDTASERSMVKKYIVDSVCYWADEYHLDGFRFDLVGLLDVETINEIVTEVHKTHPDVIFYGEGWSMTTILTKDDVLMATQANSEDTPEFAYFNDTIRDAIKGSVFDKSAGFVAGSAGDDPKITRCFKGLDNWCKSPTQTINYASCHDNNTLYDRLVLSRPDASKEEIVAMNNLAASIYMLSEGVPFMQAGEELLRTKVNDDGTFNENSYNAGDKVNTIHYSDLEDKTVKNVYEYYKGLIAFRKAHASLRFTTAEESETYIKSISQSDMHILVQEIDGSCEGEDADKITVIYNANPDAKTVKLSEGEWKVCINKDKAGVETLDTVSGEVTVPGISAMVLVQGGTEEIPVVSEPVEEVTKEKSKGGIFAGVAALAAIAGGVAVFFKKKKK